MESFTEQRVKKNPLINKNILPAGILFSGRCQKLDGLFQTIEREFVHGKNLSDRLDCRAVIPFVRRHGIQPHAVWKGSCDEAQPLNTGS